MANKNASKRSLEHQNDALTPQLRERLPMPITKHAIEKFMLLTGATNFERSRQRVKEMFNRADPVQLKPRWRLQKAFKHSTPAIYFRYSDWIFVADVADNTVITCYKCGAERWEPLSRKVANWADKL